MNPVISIATHGGTAAEDRGREQLTRLLSTYDLDRWLFTREIVIQSYVNPHSHPVLTLNTRQLDSDDGQLGTFLHEQFHWYAAENRPSVEQAVREFRETFPEVPDRLPEGAKDEYSTYLHLVICMLEFDALTLLLGNERARTVLAARPYYTWVYRQVLLDDGRIRSVLKANLLTLP
jgi:hypothetical protein